MPHSATPLPKKYAYIYIYIYIYIYVVYFYSILNGHLNVEKNNMHVICGSRMMPKG